MREIDELRGLTAGELLRLRQTPELKQCPPEETGLRGNALVLSRCCRCRGERVFPDAAAVLEALTVEEMEGLLRLLRRGEQPPAQGESGSFDAERFARLREGR